MSSGENFTSFENDFEKLGNKYDKNKLNISFNRAAFIFFTFILVLFIFSLKAFYLTGKQLPSNSLINSKKSSAISLNFFLSDKKLSVYP